MQIHEDIIMFLCNDNNNNNNNNNNITYMTLKSSEGRAPKRNKTK